MDKQINKDTSSNFEEKSKKNDLKLFIQKNKKQNEVLKKLLDNINKSKQDKSVK